MAGQHLGFRGACAEARQAPRQCCGVTAWQVGPPHVLQEEAVPGKEKTCLCHENHVFTLKRHAKTRVLVPCWRFGSWFQVMFDSFSHLNTSARLPRRPHRSLRGHRRSRHLLCGPECPSSDPETSHGLAKCKARGHYFAWISTEAVTTQHLRGPPAFTKEPRVTQICTALPRSDSVSPGDRGHRKSLWRLLSRAASA